MPAQSIINTDLYPIHDPENAERQRLVAQCRRQLEDDAICYLPDFIVPGVLAEMTAEMTAIAGQSLTIEQPCTVYPWMNNQGFPPDHPRSTLYMRRFSYLLTDMIPDSSLVHRLYMWDPLTDFVRDALGAETLYRSVCPTMSLQVNYMYEGDVLPWHFDTNDGVVSLLLETADEGGHYQMAPFVREEDDEHYDRVDRALGGDPALVKEPRMPPGTFILFKGRRSVHRVSPVGKTRRPRMIALFSYDRQPGMTFTRKSQDKLRHPDAKPFLGAKTPESAAEGFTVRPSLGDLSAPL